MAQLQGWHRWPLRILTAILLVVMAGVGWMLLSAPGRQSHTLAQEASRTAQAAGVPVEIARAKEVTATSEIRSVGTLQSDESVWIASELAARVAEILFVEGQQVKAGDVLIRLDDDLAKVELQDAKARLDLARANFERSDRLARSGSGTERARDEAAAELARAQAAHNLISVRLDKLSLRAPFDGVVGIRRVSVGAFINPGAELVNLEKIDQLKVDFKVPELYYAQVRVGQTVAVSVDALAGRVFEATIYTIDPLVDVNGRALNVRARLANDELLLRPGFFARITVKGDESRSLVMVPEEAIVPRGQEHLVYRIEDNHAVETRVRLGARRGGAVEILEGLPPGALVVIAGQTRLRDGSPVEILNLDDNV